MSEIMGINAMNMNPIGVNQIGVNSSGPLSAEELASYQRDGAIAVRGLLDIGWLERLAQVCERARGVATDRGGYFVDGKQPERVDTFVSDNNWKVDDSMRAFLMHGPLEALGRQALASDTVRLYEDLIIAKAAGNENPTPWHQDVGLWPLEGTQICSVWFCLETATQETGTLRFVAGSHHGPLYDPYLPPERRAGRETFDGEIPDIESDPAKFPIITFDVEPGDAILFHPRAVHAAYGSARSHPRRSFSIRLLGDDVRWKQRRDVYYAYLQEIPLHTGDQLDDRWFPRLNAIL